MSIRPIPIAEFRDKVLAGYTPPLRGQETFEKMKGLFTVLERTPCVRSTADLTPDTLGRFIVTGGWTNPSTVKGRSSMFRILARIAAGCGYLAEDLFARRYHPRRDLILAQTPLTHTDVGALLDSLYTAAAGSWSGHRLYALTCLVVFARVRFIEAIGLRMSDFEPREHRIATSDRSVDLDPGTAAVIGEWAGRCDSSYLFPPRHKPDADRPQKKTLLGHELRRAAEAAGLNGVTFFSLHRYTESHSPRPTTGRPTTGHRPRPIGQSVTPVTIAQLRNEVLPLYGPPANPRSLRATRQALDVLERTPGIATTADLTPEAVQRFLDTGGWGKCAKNMLSSLAVICRVAARRGYLATDPFGRRARPRSNIGIPAVTLRALENSRERNAGRGGLPASELRPSNPLTVAARMPLVIKLAEGSYEVCGKPKTLGTKAQRKLVDFLIEGRESGQGTLELRIMSGDYRNVLKRIRGDDDWMAGILEPSGPGRKDHWRIAYVDRAASNR